MPDTIPGPVPPADEPSTWANGVTLKRTRDGYTWTIAIASDDNTPKAMQRAIDIAKAADSHLTTVYGSPKTTTQTKR